MSREDRTPLLQDGREASSATPSLRGMRIVIQGLEYSVPSNVERGTLAYLLRGVNAYFNPGQMSCLIGPSGSGKTTLMDILAGRKTQGNIKGSLLFSNSKPTKAFLRRYTGYVEQFDTLLETLTVKEMLIYTAELKRPMTEAYDQKMERVKQLMEKMRLTESQNKKIGKQGGLKKRVNIGIALITDPRVLFLDEPTTGLDSNTANDIMTVVKSLVQDGTTICSTIHSPTPYTFSLFDRVLFLLGGEVVFFGERAQAVPFLESFSATEEIYDNQAEWLTAVMVKAERENQGPALAAKYAGSTLKADADKHIETFVSVTEGTDPLVLEELAVTEATVTPGWFAFKTLIKYRTLKNFQDPGFWGPRLSDKIVTTILLIVTYYGIGDDFSSLNSSNITAALFLAVVLPIFGSGIYTPSLVFERALLYREVDDGLYRPGIYLLAKMVDEVTVAVINTFVFASILFYMIGFAGDVVYFWLVYFGHLFNGIALAYFCASAAPDVNLANSMLQTFSTIFTFFCGLLILPDDIPAYWYWAYVLNYAARGFRVVMLNQFEDNDKKLAEEGFPKEAQTLELFDISDAKIGIDCAIIYAFSGGFILVAYLGMTYVRHQRR